MYKCLECGNIFECGEEAHWEERHGLDCGPYEEWTGCPICHGAYEEAQTCKRCRGEFFEDELYEGYCIDCLEKSLTYEGFRRYLIENDELLYFVFEYLCESSIPDRVTKELEELTRITLDMEKTLRADFMELAKAYIFDSQESIQAYAEWLAEWEV